jgi:hypothetical protein
MLIPGGAPWVGRLWTHSLLQRWGDWGPEGAETFWRSYVRLRSFMWTFRLGANMKWVALEFNSRCDMGWGGSLQQGPLECLLKTPSSRQGPVWLGVSGEDLGRCYIHCQHHKGVNSGGFCPTGRGPDSITWLQRSQASCHSSSLLCLPWAPAYRGWDTWWGGDAMKNQICPVFRLFNFPRTRRKCGWVCHWIRKAEWAWDPKRHMHLGSFRLYLWTSLSLQDGVGPGFMETLI